MSTQLAIASDPRAARGVEQTVLEALARHGYGEAAVFAVKLALEEALNNAILHGNGGDPAKKVRVVFDVDDRQAVIAVTDEGSGFDPQSVPDPTTDENLEKPSGRGIMLMRAYMDEVRYNPTGNQVRMLRRKR